LQDHPTPPEGEAEAPEPTPGDPTAENGSAPGRVPADDAAPSSGYNVQLDEFQGPLDLLLYLIQRDEIDIYNIPIAHITKHYLDSIERLAEFDLDNAGEFIVMASTLMRIKARLLLPVTRPGEEDDEDGDPREELVRRLLEYKRYKEAAQALQGKSSDREQFFGRGQDYGFLDQAGEEEPPELSLSLFDLLRAVNNVLEEMRSEGTHHVYTEMYTVEGQEEQIVHRIDREERFRFIELFSEMKVKMEVVVTFIALLDLLKSRRVHAYQSDAYGDIWLEAGEGPEPEPDAESESEAVETEETDAVVKEDEADAS